MNKLNKQIFENIAGRCAALADDRRKALNDLQTRTEAARTASQKFKNEDEYFEKERAGLLDAARVALKDQSAAFARKTLDSAAQLREELRKHICEPANPAVMDRLHIYQQFGIKPSRTEIEQMLHDNHGNALGLAAISAVLTEVKAPYKVNFKSVRDFEEDIEAIEKLASTADGFAPVDQFSQACAVWNGRQVPGAITGQTWTTTGLTLRRYDFESALKQVTAAADSWAGDIVYKVVEAALPDEGETPPASSTSMEEAAADPVEAVRVRAAERAELDARADSALSQHYLK